MIYILEDDPILMKFMEEIFNSNGYHVKAFDDLNKAMIDLVKSEEPEMIISNTRISDTDGRRFDEEYKKFFPNRQTLLALLEEGSDPAEDIILILNNNICSKSDESKWTPPCSRPSFQSPQSP